MANYVCFQSFCQKSAERKSPKSDFHIFVLMSDLGFELGPYTLSIRPRRLSKITLVPVNILSCKVLVQTKILFSLIGLLLLPVIIIYGVFFSTKKMCTLFQKMHFRVCFLKTFRPLKGCYILF